MKVYEQEHSFTLPDGASISVKQLGGEHAYSTEVVMASGWSDAYVTPGLITSDQAKAWVDPDNPVIVARLATRIEAGRDSLIANDKAGALYLGAFATEAAGSMPVQVGMIKYSGNATNPFKLVPRWVLHQGEIEEIDVMSGWSHLGVGRALVHVAMLHAREVGHLTFDLDVVRTNVRARNFYTRHLAMVESGKSEHVEGMPPAMDRTRMRGLVRKTQDRLLNANPWLAPAA